MTTSTRVALGVLVLLALAGSALASSNGDLTALSNREYEEYARDRFEWLTGEARSGHRLESKARRDCKPGAPLGTDGERACEMAKAASDQADRILQEGRDLMAGLEQRLGTVPPWAREMDTQLDSAAGRNTLRPAAAVAP
jgi:hypothetical protein